MDHFKSGVISRMTPNSKNSSTAAKKWTCTVWTNWSLNSAKMFFLQSSWKLIKLKRVTRFQLFLGKISTHACSDMQIIFPIVTNTFSTTLRKMITWRSSTGCSSAITLILKQGKENAIEWYKAWVSFSLIFGSIPKRSLTNALIKTATQLSVRWATCTNILKLTAA